MFVTHWNGVDDCLEPAKDCLPEVVVTPSLAEIIEEVSDNQNDYDFDKINNLVLRFESDFQATFGDQITFDLKNKKCKIYAKVNSNKSFLIVPDSKDEITLSVRPFIN